jgi:hypothetical protein
LFKPLNLNAIQFVSPIVIFLKPHTVNVKSENSNFTPCIKPLLESMLLSVVLKVNIEYGPALKRQQGLK